MFCKLRKIKIDREVMKIIFLAEILILGVSWPYLSGNHAYAPKEILYTGTFAASNLVSEQMTERDRFGQRDYFDQERVFLRFYRDSIRKGELPLWNEKTFGGISQEDSMIYSYLLPFNIPWLFISNDHIAKGLQIFLILNYGMFGFVWWCRILRLSTPWTLLVIVLGLFTPLSLHFLAHMHQPGLYFSGLYITAAFHRYLEQRKPFHLILFFTFLVFSIIFNFLSILLFISIFLGIISITHFFYSGVSRRELFSRVLMGFSSYILALLFMSFFLGPILLESHLTREPIHASYRSYAPWENVGVFISTLSVFGLYNTACIPFLLILPVLLCIALIKPRFSDIPVGMLAIIIFYCFVVMVTGFEGFQFLFRKIMPGMKYSNSALFRMLFFGNLFGIILLAWLSENMKKDRHDRK